MRSRQVRTLPLVRGRILRGSDNLTTADAADAEEKSCYVHHHDARSADVNPQTPWVTP
jgi:hypothetical protein